MNPMIPPVVFGALLGILIHVLSIEARHIGNVLVSANSWWSGMHQCLGICYTKVVGLPPGIDPEAPHGLKDHYTLRIGVLLFTFHFTWFGQVPSAE